MNRCEIIFSLVVHIRLSQYAHDAYYINEAPIGHAEALIYLHHHSSGL